MLNDEPSPSCERCYEHERNGYDSLRINANRDYQHWKNYAFTNTNDDGSLDEMKLVYLDIRFSNLCNFACRTCGPELSSGWYDDSLKLKNIDINYPKFQRLKSTAEQLWEELEPNLQHVEGVYFAGGEPLMMEEHYKLLEYFINNGKTDITINYNTNFSLLRYKDKDCIELWKRFKHVRIGASVEGMQARGEYIRHGFDWAKFESNVIRFKNELPNLDFYISCTLSIFNALHMPDFHRFMITKGYIKAADWDVNVLLFPEHYRLQVLPQPYKTQFLEKYESMVKYLEAQPGTSRAVGGYRSAINYMKEQDLHASKIDQFLKITDDLDKLRNQSFKDTFTEYKL
jgi:organic radical activating enzyme